MYTCIVTCVCVCVADPNERAKDMINAYQRECSTTRVKPVTKLLEQLERLDDLSTPIDNLDLKGVKLDNASCEVLETVLSRVQTNTLDLEKTNLEDEVMQL
ncbi:Protein phosphatase 1 regulatory subunit 37 [Geodia barretti]|uniref:Protein phosphatase 1 regulatory subunit 37 n=1 Tax=Geodia barretti TaxID=519541 RepID=A0AA35SN63_GEOBA|nr:Protein phosphatase 1 regulatory subunit 37 [Geodia barretti]